MVKILVDNLETGVETFFETEVFNVQGVEAVQRFVEETMHIPVGEQILVNAETEKFLPDHLVYLWELPEAHYPLEDEDVKFYLHRKVANATELVVDVDSNVSVKGEFQVQGSTTTISLKKMIDDRCGLPPQFQQLTIRNYEMNDSSTMRDYITIGNMQTIQLTVPHADRLRRFNVLVNDVNHPLFIYKSATIELLFDRMKKKTALERVQDYDLLLEDEILELNHPLENIPADSTILIVEKEEVTSD